MTITQKVVTPVKTGVQGNCNSLNSLDSGFRRNDENMRIPTFCMIVKYDWSAYHRISAEPQVNPAPKASSSTRSPGAARPSRTASSSAIGMVAPEVFP